MRRPRNTPIPVVVLAGHDAGLAVARSLGRRGVAVHAVGCGRVLRHSRFVHWSPEANALAGPAEWLSWLLGPGRERLAGAVLFPCDDSAVELVARNRALLDPHYRLMPTDDRIVLAMLDKARTAELAAAAGIPAPRTWTIGSRRELDRIRRVVGYPCTLKPRSTHRFRKRFGQKLFVADDETELAERFERCHESGLEMILSEIVPGPDADFCSYWTYVDATGRSLFHFTKRKLRQYPIHFGGGTFHVTDWIPEVAALGRRFVERIGLRGLAAVEFKRDARDGQLKLIECNVRFTSAVEIAVRAQLDVPHLVYGQLTGIATPIPIRFRSGVRLWFPLLDVRAAVAYCRSGELTLREWLGTLRRGTAVAWWQWSDPLPAVAVALDRIRPGHAAIPDLPETGESMPNASPPEAVDPLPDSREPRSGAREPRSAQIHKLPGMLR